MLKTMPPSGSGIVERKLTASDIGGAPATHASQHHWDGADPLTAIDVYAEPDLGDIGSAGVYGIQETGLGLHGISAINRTNIVGINKLVKTIETDTYTVEDIDEVIICNKTTAMFVYVPTTTGTGQRLYIKNINIGVVTIDCSATETMDAVETIALAQWDTVELVSSDTGKWIIAGQPKSYFDELYLALTGGTLTGGLTITAATDAVNSSKITDKDGNVILSVDTVNNRIGIGLISPSGILDIIVPSGTGGRGTSEVCGIRIQDGANPAINEPRSLRMGVNTEANGYGYIQFSYEGTDYENDNGLKLNPLGGKVTIGVGVSTAAGLTIAGLIGVRSTDNTIGSTTNGINFYPGGIYTLPTAAIQGIYDQPAWYQGGGLVFKTIRSADISGSNPIERMRIASDGKVGIGTTAPDKQLEINSADGNCLRLTYNDANGSATYYTDFNVSSAGLLTIAPSGGDVIVDGKLKLTSETLKVTPEAGMLEYDGTSLYFTEVDVRRAVTVGNDTRVTDLTVTDTVTETTIHTSAVAANTFRAGKMFKITVLGKFSTANASDYFTLRSKMGGTIILSAVLTAKNVTNEHFRSEFWLTIRTIGSGGTYAAHLETALGNQVVSTTPVTGSVDTTAAEDLTLTVEWSAANAGHTLTVMQSLLEVIN